MTHEGKCHHELEYFNLKRFEGDESDLFEPNGVKRRSQSLPLIIEQRVAWTLRSISDRFTDDIDSTKFGNGRRRHSLTPETLQSLISIFQDDDEEDEDEGSSVDP